MIQKNWFPFNDIETAKQRVACPPPPEGGLIGCVVDCETASDIFTGTLLCNASQV